MPDLSILDHWWSAWMALFPAKPVWNPYGASFVLAIALTVAARMAGHLRFWLLGHSRRRIDFGLDE
jgi:hypothetical protein